MVRGGCRKCGQRTTNNRLCNECQRLERQDFFAASSTTSDNSDDSGGDELEHECTACGTEYFTDGSDPCPDCGARRRRYIGPLPGEGEQPGTNGGSA